MMRLLATWFSFRNTSRTTGIRGQSKKAKRLTPEPNCLT
jgi:hypothetical protein